MTTHSMRFYKTPNGAMRLIIGSDHTQDVVMVVEKDGTVKECDTSFNPLESFEFQAMYSKEWTVNLWDILNDYAAKWDVWGEDDNDNLG